MQSGKVVAARRWPQRLAVRRSWLPWVAFAVIAALAINTLVLQVGKGLTFFYDEWAFLLRRRGVSLDVFLQPHGPHLSVIPIAIYKTMLRVFGLDYRPYQWMLMVFLIGLAAVVYLYARPRIGPWVGLMPVVVILFSGSFWEDTMWPFQIGFIGALLCGIGAFMALDRQTTRGDLLASALLLLSIAQASVGLPFLGGVALELILRRQWRRLWIPAAPLALYVIWYIAYPHPGAERSNLSKIPHYVWESAASAVGSIFALTRDAGKVLIWVGIALLVDAVIRRRTNARVWALLATAVLFWTATGLLRAQLATPDQSRYLLPGATLVMLAFVEAYRGLRPNRTLALILIALVPIFYTHGRDVLRVGAAPTILSFSPYLEGDYRALDLIRPYLKLDAHQWHIDGLRAPDIDVGSYYGLIDTFGDPAPSFAQLEQLGEPARANADLVMVVGTQTGPAQTSKPLTQGPAPQVVTKYLADATPAAGCVSLHPAPGAAGPYVDVAVPAQGIRFRPDGPLSYAGLHMFGDNPQLFPALAPGGWYSVKPPPVRSPKPWLARFGLETAPVRVCTGG